MDKMITLGFMILMFLFEVGSEFRLDFIWPILKIYFPVAIPL